MFLASVCPIYSVPKPENRRHHGRFRYFEYSVGGCPRVLRHSDASPQTSRNRRQHAQSPPPFLRPSLLLAVLPFLAACEALPVEPSVLGDEDEPTLQTAFDEHSPDNTVGLQIAHITYYNTNLRFSSILFS